MQQTHFFVHMPSISNGEEKKTEQFLLKKKFDLSIAAKDVAENLKIRIRSCIYISLSLPLPGRFLHTLRHTICDVWSEFFMGI